MPLLDVVGREVSVAPEQIGATGLNAGVMFGLTVVVNVAVVAHWPGSGVNVYVPVVVLLTTAGTQAPVIPFDDVTGKVTTVPPSQIVVLVPKGKLGKILGFTVTLNV